MVILIIYLLDEKEVIVTKNLKGEELANELKIRFNS